MCQAITRNTFTPDLNVYVYTTSVECENFCDIFTTMRTHMLQGCVTNKEEIVKPLEERDTLLGCPKHKATLHK